MARWNARPLLILAAFAAVTSGRSVAVSAQSQPGSDYIVENTALARANARKAFEIVFRVCVESGLDFDSVAAKAKTLGWPLVKQDSIRLDKARPDPAAKLASWRFEVAPSDATGTAMKFALDHVTAHGAIKCTLSFTRTWDSSLAQVGVLGFRRPPDAYPHEQDPASKKVERLWNLVDKSGKAFSIKIGGPRDGFFDLDATRELVIETRP